MLNGNNRDVVSLRGNSQINFAVGTSVASSQPLDPGIYDVTCNVAINIVVSAFRFGSALGSIPTLNANTGYLIPANKVISIYIEGGDVLSAIAASAGTLRMVKTGDIAGVVRTEFVYTPPVEQGGAYPYKPISNHTRLPNEFSVDNKQVMVQSRHIFMEDMVSSVFQAEWPLYYRIGDSGEVVLTTPSTGRASIHYYDRSGLYKVLRLSGAASGSDVETGQPGGYIKLKEIVSALQGSTYMLRFWGNLPDGMFFSQRLADYANGDIFRYGATTPDLTGVDTAFSDTFQGSRHMYLPAFIGGVATRPTLGINEDSRGVGFSDTPNNDYGLSGQFDRKFGSRMATVNVSIPGETAEVFKDPSKCGRSHELLRRADYHGIGLATNDTIYKSNTLPQILSDMQSVVTIIGKPAIGKSIDPAAIGVTLQRPARETIRLGCSDAIIAPPVWLIGAIDPRSVLENARTGQWASEAYHEDGTHEVNTANQLAADTMAFDFSKVGNPGVVSVIKPIALDPAAKASNVTLSGNNLVATGLTISNPWPFVRATRGASSGKKIFAVRPTTYNVSMELGLVNASFPINVAAASTSKITDSLNSFGINGTGGYGANGAFPAGVNAMVANTWTYVCVDFTAGLVWFKTGAGNWNNSGTADPATGVGGRSFSYAGQTMFPATTAYGSVVEFNFGALAYGITVPTGFSNFT